MVPPEILIKMAEARPELARRIGPLLHERPDLAYFVLSGQSTYVTVEETKSEQRSVNPAAEVLASVSTTPEIEQRSIATPTPEPAPAPSRESADDDHDASADLADIAAKSAGVTLPTRAQTTEEVSEHAPDASADLLSLVSKRVSEQSDDIKADVASIFASYGTDPEEAA